MLKKYLHHWSNKQIEWDYKLIKKDNICYSFTNPYNGNGYVKLGTYNFETAEDYTCLGTILANKNELRPDIEQELRLPIEHTYYALLPVLKNQSVYSEHKH